MENKSNQGFLEKVFHLSENHTDVKTEVIAGITTFMTMAYILAVNPNILSAAGMDRGAVFTATALASLVATLLMAAFANYPFVLAPGMGLNAYFAYTVVLQMGYTWQMALAAVFVEGLISVSYTHLDVYKRQVPVPCPAFRLRICGRWYRTFQKFFPLTHREYRARCR